LTTPLALFTFSYFSDMSHAFASGSLRSQSFYLSLPHS
jgi:hypothetical protein